MGDAGLSPRKHNEEPRRELSVFPQAAAPQRQCDSRNVASTFSRRSTEGKPRSVAVNWAEPCSTLSEQAEWHRDWQKPWDSRAQAFVPNPFFIRLNAQLCRQKKKQKTV